jgi:hypothetical protein
MTYLIICAMHDQDRGLNLGDQQVVGVHISPEAGTIRQEPSMPVKGQKQGVIMKLTSWETAAAALPVSA